MKHPELRISTVSNIREHVVELVVKNRQSFTTVRSSLLDTIEKDLKKKPANVDSTWLKSPGTLLELLLHLRSLVHSFQPSINSKYNNYMQ